VRCDFRNAPGLMKHPGLQVQVQPPRLTSERTYKYGHPPGKNRRAEALRYRFGSGFRPEDFRCARLDLKLGGWRVLSFDFDFFTRHALMIPP
jgi:hypothetical protein